METIDADLDELRSAFMAASSSQHWRVYEDFVNRILDAAIDAGLTVNA